MKPVYNGTQRDLHIILFQTGFRLAQILTSREENCTVCARLIYDPNLESEMYATCRGLYTVDFCTYFVFFLPFSPILYPFVHLILQFFRSFSELFSIFFIFFILPLFLSRFLLLPSHLHLSSFT
jgi:hypothetical protein